MLAAATLFLGSAAAYIALRSSNYICTDGAARAFEVYHSREPFLHTNEHMLHPVNIFLWTRALQMLGLPAETPTQFIGLAQAMNAIAAASCLVIFYMLCVTVTRRPRLSLFASVGYGVSHAFVTHATNSAEPMVGLLWSLVAVLLTGASLRAGKAWLGLFGGVALMLSMATYQGMVLIGPAILALIWYWPARSFEGLRAVSRTRNLALFLAGCLVALILIYGTAYYLSGTRGLVPMALRFVHVPADDVYGGFALPKLVALPLGLTYALLPCLPLDCTGFRCLMDPGHQKWIIVVLISLGLVSGIAAPVGLVLLRIWKRFSEIERLGVISSSVCILFDGLALSYWMPTYDKLWLQPTACIFLLSAIVAGATMRMLDLPPLMNNLFRLGAVCLLIIMAASNISVAVYRHVAPSPYLADVDLVAQVVTGRDLLVGDWNGILILHQNIYADRDNTFNVPTEAIFDRSATNIKLQNRIDTIQSSGGEVYFLGILDIPQPKWVPAIGEYGPSYRAFGRYRRCSKIVNSFVSPVGIITLRVLADPFDQCESVQTEHSTARSAMYRQ
jgi:hypothetical protein